MDLKVIDPNFSIIVPTGCNANCSFCFWKNKATMNKKDYLQNLADTLCRLPVEFQQCSITGGEPTTLPWLDEILSLVRKRFIKVVLTTNGTNLGVINTDYIDHLNISRHHYNEEHNNDIFKFNETIPTNMLLRYFTPIFNDRAVNVTLNCWLPDNFGNKDFITRYIEFAKGIGVNAVSFRKDMGSLSALPVEKYFGKTFNPTECYVCKSYSRYIYGMKTIWRFNLSEPSVELNGVYELILQTNGELTSDWKGNDIIDLNLTRKAAAFRVNNYQTSTHSCGGRGCGS